jgi:hypothetical protein
MVAPVEKRQAGRPCPGFFFCDSSSGACLAVATRILLPGAGVAGHGPYAVAARQISSWLPKTIGSLLPHIPLICKF